MKAFFQIPFLFIINSNFSKYKFLLIFSQKNLKKLERHFKEIIPFETHSRKSWRHFVILKNSKVFFQKNPNFQRFENYFPSRILRQICYNLVKKIHNQNEPTSLLRELNWQTSGKKNGPICERFRFHIKNMAENNCKKMSSSLLHTSPGVIESSKQS